MKFKFLYTFSLSILLWTLYNSNSAGAGSANFNCNNCHNGSSTTTKIDSIILRDVNTLDKMIKYSPANPYIITIYGSNSGALNRFGFQMTHGGKGSFTNPSADCQVSGNIWEHKQKITGTSSKFQVSARWNSPAKGTGSITLEAYLNAVDNSNDASGDKPSSKFSYTFDELTASDSASVEVRITNIYDPKNPNSVIIFKAFPTNGGPTPEYQWKVNGKNIGTKTSEDTYSSSTIRGGDTVTCWMYSSQFGALPNPAISKPILVAKTNPTSRVKTETNPNFPNIHVFNKVLYFNEVKEKIELSIYSTQGKLAFYNPLNHTTSIDLSHLSNGIYIVKLQVNNEIVIEKVELK